MSKFASTLVGALVVVVLAGCSDNLVVQNPNAPDETRALARPTDVEGLVGSAFRTIHNNTDGATLTLNAQLLCAGMENYSGLANAGMGPACAVPRSSVDNSRGNQTLSEKYTPYLNVQGAVRGAALGLNRLSDPSFTFFPTNTNQVARDRAFAFFEMGVGLGDIAMVYDSGAAIGPADDPMVVLPLVGSDSLGAYALALLDSAIAIATAKPGGFPLPASWVNGSTMSAATFIQVAHSYKARIRAGLARTPAQRGALDWAAVIADATAGITTDFILQAQSSAPSWGYRPAQMDLFADWHQMWQFMIGMADISGQYDVWLAQTNVALRAPFLIQTPDTRFPAGATRTVQNTNSPALPAAGQYFRNRKPGDDVPGNPLGFSMYDFYRYAAVMTSTPPRTGPVSTFTLAENNLLRAEGLIRTGAVAAALPFINATRTTHGLPALVGIADTLTLIPNVPACVPRIPAAPTFTSTVCGNVLEALKWEKRMETAYSHWGAWWIDGRGWGDLPANTPLQYPVPYQELDTRLMPLYTYNTGAAAGRYGL